MSIPAITEAAIRAHAAPESFSRGSSYYARGAVGDLRLRGATLTAEVEGSDVEPYRVTLRFDAAGITDADCTCPYDWGGWCKHIVAVALKCAAEPQGVEQLPPVEQRLADLTREQLLALLVDLAAADPDVADEVDRRATLARLAAAPSPQPDASQGAAPPRRSPIDQAAIRQQVRHAIRDTRRGRYDSYDDEEEPGADAAAQLRPLLDQAARFTEAGDGRSALAVLEALTDAYLDDGRRLFDEVEEVYGSLEGPAVELLRDIAAAWAEALLAADLSENELDGWGDLLAGWQGEAADVSAELDDLFDIALTAAEQGWAYPPLRAAMRGEYGESGAWDRDAPDYADTLAQIRLRVLDRQGRHQEYLHLARAEGQTGRYVAMLARLGRTREALAAGLSSLSTVVEFGEVARLLRDQGDPEGALQLAEHAIRTTPPPDQSHTPYGTHHIAELAGWAADLAAGLGHTQRAIEAATAAFRAAPSLSAYLKAHAVAGDRWPEVAPGLLERLRRSPNAQAKVDVFLHERLIEDAISAVQKSYDSSLLRRVMDAALDARPDWVIQAATAQAEPIMNAGKADKYDDAADWLRRARGASAAAGREDDWRAYIGGVRARHARKHKLIGLLSKL